MFFTSQSRWIHSRWYLCPHANIVPPAPSVRSTSPSWQIAQISSAAVAEAMVLTEVIRSPRENHLTYMNTVTKNHTVHAYSKHAAMTFIGSHMSRKDAIQTLTGLLSRSMLSTWTLTTLRSSTSSTVCEILGTIAFARQHIATQPIRSRASKSFAHHAKGKPRSIQTKNETIKILSRITHACWHAHRWRGQLT